MGGGRELVTNHVKTDKRKHSEKKRGGNPIKIVGKGENQQLGRIYTPTLVYLKIHSEAALSIPTSLILESSTREDTGIKF